MATVTASKRSAGIINTAAGSFTSDNTATTVTLGFNPISFKVVNSTDTIIWEKLDGMAAANSVKTVTAGTTTVDTGSAILFNGDGTVTLSQTLVGNSKAISWVAIA